MWAYKLGMDITLGTWCFLAVVAGALLFVLLPLSVGPRMPRARQLPRKAKRPGGEAGALRLQ